MNNKLLESQLTWVAIALFVLGTAIYVFPAGHIQPGQYLAPIIVLIGASFIRWRNLNTGDKWLMAFGLYALVINTYYFFTFQNPEFLYSIFYWGYGISLFITFSHILFVSPKVRSVIKYTLLLCLIIILGLWSVGYMRDEIFDNRFMALFNDPNQMGLWLLCAFLSIYLLSGKGLFSNRFVQLMCLILITLLILATGSRSATFGLLVLSVGFIWLRFFKEKISLSRPALVLISIIFIVSMVAVLGSKVKQFGPELTKNSMLYKEVPIKRLFTTKWKKEATRRGYFRPIEYPKYLLLGAGQGEDKRFNANHEIHSSFLSVFFNYGIIGFTLFMGFLYQIFRRLGLPEAIMLSAPFVYGLFTYGLRTPIFWVLMAIVVATRPFNNSEQIKDTSNYSKR